MDIQNIIALAWAAYNGRIISAIWQTKCGWWIAWADNSDGLLFTIWVEEE